MHLITPYAPPSFLKPVLIVSTLFTSITKETAVRFANALHVWHALDVSNCHDLQCSDRMASDIIRDSRYSEWIIVQTHETPGSALEFHLALTDKFINGGNEDEWNRGWESYLELYEQYCSVNIKNRGH